VAKLRPLIIDFISKYFSPDGGRTFNHDGFFSIIAAKNLPLYLESPNLTASLEIAMKLHLSTALYGV
jgi:hypothetical protein